MKSLISGVLSFGALSFGTLLALTTACTKCSTDTPQSTTASMASTTTPGGGEGMGPIKIGEVGSMTGSEATFGVATHQGMTMAFDEINAQGGVKGRPLTVVSLDDQSKPEEAAQAITRLITQDRVIAVVGEVASSRSLAMGGIAQDHKIPMITPSSTNPKVTTLGDYIFRVCFIDPFQGKVMAQFVLNDLKMKRVAILRDVKSDYSAGLSEFFREALQKGGAEIVIEESYNAGDIDFKSQLTAIRAAHPEAIYVPGYYTDVGLIARQARALDLKQPLLGGDGWDSHKLWEIGGEALVGSYFSNHYSHQNSAPHIQTFVTNFKQRFGLPPDSLAALGYDAARILADAMTRAPSLDPTAIRDALAKTVNFNGVTGKITMDPDRNAQKSAVVLKIADGGVFQYQTTIEP